MTRPSARLGLATPSCTPTLAAITILALALSAVGCGGSGGAHDGGHDATGTAGSGPDGGAGAGGGTAGGTADGGGDTSTACTADGAGSLVLAVVGLPAGTVPMVRVSPAGMGTPVPLTVGTPVAVPSGGGYTIEYRRVKTAPDVGGIVGTAYYVSGSSFDGCVKGGGATTTATLTYVAEPGSQHLWVSVSDAPTLGNELGSFASADLAASAAKNPALWKTMNFDERPAGSAFDSSGNLWVPGGGVINMYPMAMLATAGAAPPMVVLAQPTGSKARFAAFDAAGNLWITRGNPGTAHAVVRYAFADLAASGMPTPDIVITNAALTNPAGLAFAANGDLWVASEDTGKVVRYNRENITASTTAAPDVILGAKTPAGAPVASVYAQPTGIALDQDGKLWVSFLDQLVGFTTTQQAATADIAGPLTVNMTAGTAGIAFDESGGLWFSNNMNKLQRLSKASLTAGGDVTPDIVIDSSELGYAEGIALDPSPTWSPIQDWQ